jgi:hypothetical protein
LRENLTSVTNFKLVTFEGEPFGVGYDSNTTRLRKIVTRSFPLS